MMSATETTGTTTATAIVPAAERPECPPPEDIVPRDGVPLVEVAPFPV